MANSNLPGPAGTHHRHHHRHHPHKPVVAPKALPPPRTPGPLGHNDHGDPTLTSLLGWTPSVTGVLDWADRSLKEVEHLWYKTLGSIGFDPHVGAPVSHGAAPGVAPKGELTLDEAHLLALKITTVFEGTGAKSMNYKSLAGDFDGMATSFGLVQWNFGMGTLGKLLNKMRGVDPTTFDNCFPADADYATLKTALANGDKAAQMAWARTLYAKPAGKKAWHAAFDALGAVTAFNKIQFDSAINDYNPTVVKDITLLRTLAPLLMAKVEFRSYAALFDCAIQQGGLHKAEKEIRAKVASDKPATQFALLTLAVTERANRASHASVADCLSRRNSILNGKTLTYTAFGKTMTRNNSQYGICLTEGAKIVDGL